MPPLLGDSPKIAENRKTSTSIGGPTPQVTKDTDGTDAIHRRNDIVGTGRKTLASRNSAGISHEGIPRIMSAPALGARKRHKPRRQPLVEQHFKIDKENRALLPGVPKYDADLARDIHDFFNLICLVPIVMLNILNWDWNKLSNMGSLVSKNGVAFKQCWTGEYFDLFFYTTVAYFIIDLIWVCVVPRSVKSPSTIIQHHVASLAYLFIPYYFETFQFLFGVCMSVELNTWFLIARRVFNKQGFSPWTLELPYMFSVRVKLISVLFYLTWLTIRCMLYPYVLVIFYKIWMNKVTREEEIALMTASVLQSVFCLLNARWTIDLMNSKIKQWRTKGKTKISSGL